MGERPRLALCNELSQVLMRAKIDVGFFLNHGEELNQHWLTNRVVSDGLVQFTESPKGQPVKVKFQRLTKKEKRAMRKPPPFIVRSPKAASKEWKPDCTLFTREQALAFVKNPGNPVFQMEGFIRKYKIPDPLPRKWARRLRDAMISHFQLGRGLRTNKRPRFAYLDDALDMNESAISNQ